MNEAKYVKSEFIRLKTFLSFILSDLERVNKAEIDAYAFSETLWVSGQPKPPDDSILTWQQILKFIIFANYEMRIIIN